MSEMEPGQSQPAETDHVPASLPPKRRRRLGPLIALAVVVIVVAGSVVGYFAATGTVAAGYRVTAERALEQARTDNNQVANSLKSPQLGSKSLGDFQDAASYQQSMALLRSQLTDLQAHTRRARSLIDIDLLGLHRESDRLHSALDAVLLWPARGSLQMDRQRVESVAEGFTAARHALDILLDQETAAIAVVNAMDQFVQIVPLEQEGDFANALAMYPHIEAVMQQAVMLSANPNVPQQLHTLMTAMLTFVADNKLLLQAMKARDAQAGDAAAKKLDADQNALTFDEHGFEAAEDGLLKPYLDRYNSAMKRAGFHLNTA